MKQEFNEKWFKDRLDQLGLGVRSSAPRMDLDPSQWSRLMKGRNSWHVPHLVKAARVLQTPITELLMRLGEDLTGVPPERGTAVANMGASGLPAIAEPPADYFVPVVGIAEMDGRVTRIAERQAAAVPRSVGAVRANAIASPFDGCTVYFGKPGAPAECIGRACIVDTDEGLMFGVVRPGMSPDRFDVANFFNLRERREDVAVKSMAPVVSMQF